jgi:hypothetical protein
LLCRRSSRRTYRGLHKCGARPSLSRARSPGARLRRILRPQDRQSDRCRRHARAEVDAAARARRKPGPDISGRTTMGLLSARARASPAGEIASCALSSSAAIRAACSRKVAPASASTAPCVVRDRSWTPSACSRRASRRLTIDFDTPSLRAAGETPPASATSRNARTSPRSKGVPPSATPCLQIEG